MLNLYSLNLVMQNVLKLNNNNTNNNIIIIIKIIVIFSLDTFLLLYSYPFSICCFRFGVIN